MTKINIAIVGGRDFSDFALMDNVICDYIASIESVDKITIVSGGAKGADSLADKLAKKYGFGLMVFEADWEGQGKKAGYQRNKQIIEYANVVFAFWDGVSKGTAHSIKLAQEAGLALYVTNY